MPFDTPVGFWSYAHEDNAKDKGRILGLATNLADEYSLLTGSDLTIFVDREDLKWGDAWNERIAEALQDTTFLIPIITPRYFQSEYCRSELLRFYTLAKSVGISEFLLPILYVDVPGLSTESSDEVVQIVASTQYVTWTSLRLKSADSEEYASAVNKLALRLQEIAAAAQSKPVRLPGEDDDGDAGAPLPEAPKSPDPGAGGVTQPDSPSRTATEDASDRELTDDPDSDEPGLIDLIADLESAFPAWQASLEAFPPVMERVNAATEKATEEIENGDREGKGFANRVLVSRRLAESLREPADDLLRLGAEYSTRLFEVDPGVRALVQLTVESDPSGEDLEATCSFFATLRELVQSGRTSAEQTQRMVSTVGVNAKRSRDLRPVLTDIQAALRHVIDGQTVIDEWERIIDQSGINCPPRT